MAFEFKIQLRGLSKPAVYRKLKVPENMTFDRFHTAIQNTFGWHNCHLYEFSAMSSGSHFQIEIPHPDNEGDSFDSRKVKLKEIFKHEKQTFTYIYDFGDDWIHKITLEKITPEKIIRTYCIGGKGKCPPEDCGGIHGYQQFLEIINNPKDPEYKEMREWAWLSKGKEWDVNEFDLEKANARAARD